MWNTRLRDCCVSYSDGKFDTDKAVIWVVGGRGCKCELVNFLLGGGKHRGKKKAGKNKSCPPYKIFSKWGLK